MAKSVDGFCANHMPPKLGPILEQHQRTVVTVFVQCIRCGAREEFEEETGKHISDEAAAAMFRDLGWSILPTLCPECRAKEAADAER